VTNPGTWDPFVKQNISLINRDKGRSYERGGLSRELSVVPINVLKPGDRTSVSMQFYPFP
jgi:hypothetical protein